MTIRERAQTYLELASKAKGIDWNLDEPLPDDYWFVKLLEQSPAEGVWATQKLLEALELLEDVARLLNLDDVDNTAGKRTEKCRDMIWRFLITGER